ncbi:uncharacterized protein J3R85_009253 [Psidium guajava]|nr:uncharacterized protein J3R85_009253 [Psidium guajava]
MRSASDAFAPLALMGDEFLSPKISPLALDLIFHCLLKSSRATLCNFPLGIPFKIPTKSCTKLHFRYLKPNFSSWNYSQNTSLE